ncbi:MAG TPA: ATP-binding cassette domain-containing protein, partial [Spirochaetia bacterium]|nr:ATP-binding cassette domain-containing protein [Spirochaetia bacterium]
VGGVPVHTLDEKSLSLWRGKKVGVVFQFFQLLPTLTVAENVMLPMDFCNTFALKERPRRALDLLDRVGIADQAYKLPASLSGGQQQRAAIARALANDPSLIAADEPTGNLDSHTSEDVLELFTQLAREGKTVIMVTHERDVRTYVSREIRLMDGMLQGAREAVHA